MIALDTFTLPQLLALCQANHLISRYECLGTTVRFAHSTHHLELPPAEATLYLRALLRNARTLAVPPAALPVPG